MTQQRRPINGGLGNGQPIGLLQATPGTTVHTIPAVSAERVGPVTDLLTLFINNTTAGALIASVIVGTTTIELTVGADATLQVFDDHPITGTVGTAFVISIFQAGANNALLAFGSFTRS